ncbi:Gfo/Idh/MocA family protein [Paenibacillus eucommiae]|uniref:Dehydrogenase n=1 Tax=Paenibacillus eucommiae TaxID=1355755 RepID=A0ABS4J0Q3_9BACL|nr:Gfo/Idh/MocA family oxidoreductase [Paenibacillus eucommiae]MBP1992339.1 putative dehydrogenase [Paenibacillus eucommiae]
MVKIGLIGAGFMGTTHALCYEALNGKSDFQVTAVADVDLKRAQELAAKFGAAVFASGEALIESADVDTVDICLPTYLHTAHALQAMKKGLNVLVEKPVCLNEEEAAELLKTQSETGVQVMVGQCLRFWTEYQYLKELVDNQTYGELLTGVFTRVSPRPGWAWDEWLHDINRSGSVALDLHVHDVDFVRYLLGSPDKITSQTAERGNTIEHIFSQYHYPGKLVSLEASWDYPGSFPFEMAYRVKFKEATVVFSSAKSPSLSIYKNDGEVLVPELKSDLEQQAGDTGGNISSLGGYINEIQYFLDRLSNNQTIENATLEDGIESMKLVLEEIRAAKQA